MSNIDKFLYLFYLLCLPFGQFIRIFPENFTLPIAFSTLIMMFALFKIILNHGIKQSAGVQSFGRLYLFMAGYSILASIILTFTLDYGLKEPPIRRCLGGIVLYFLLLCSIYYNWYCLSRLKSFKVIKNVFQLQTIVLLFVGFLQLGVMSGVGVGLYSALCSIFVLRDVVYLTTLDRGITFFASEPSLTSSLCFVVIPFILFSISNNKGKKKLIYVIEFLLMAILFLLSNSSSALISFLFVCVAYIVLYVFHLRLKKLVMFGAFAIGAIVAVLYSLDISTSNKISSDTNSFEYVVLGKVLDKDNMSTAMRASTVINDMKIFYDYPLTGVGDGNQGYYYAQNIPAWVLPSSEVQNLLHGSKLSNGGGNFFPCYLSAFGLVGIIVFLSFLRKYRQSYRQSFLRQSRNFEIIYVLGISLLLLGTWYIVDIKADNTAAFLLSLPCVMMKKRKINEI